jgi:hypothetical protein
MSPAVSEVLVACAEFMRLIGGRGSLMITELSLVQAMLSWGAHPEPLGLPWRTRDGTLIAVFSHASAFAARNLRKARGLERPVLHWADGLADTPRLIADILGVDPFDEAWTPPGALTPLQRSAMSPLRLAGAYWGWRPP